MVSDCYAAQLKVVTSNKQICYAHLLREREGLHEKYNSKWAIKQKSKLEQIICLSKRRSKPRKTVERLEKEQFSQTSCRIKIKSLHKETQITCVFYGLPA